MKVRLSVYSAKPYQRVFTIDEVGELQTELVYLLNYKLLKGKILGFCLSQVSLEENKDVKVVKDLRDRILEGRDTR